MWGIGVVVDVRNRRVPGLLGRSKPSSVRGGVMDTTSVRSGENKGNYGDQRKDEVPEARDRKEDPHS